jgi:hypothetical protein
MWLVLACGTATTLNGWWQEPSVPKHEPRWLTCIAAQTHPLSARVHRQAHEPHILRHGTATTGFPSPTHEASSAAPHLPPCALSTA